MRRYCFIRYVIFVSASPLFGNFQSSRFPVISLLFTPISCDNWGSMRGTVRGAR